MKKISNEFYQRQLTIIIFVVIFKNIASKLEKMGPIFSSFNPFPSLPSVATDDRKQFQPLKTKLDHYFRNSIDAKTLLAFLKDAKIA